VARRRKSSLRAASRFNLTPKERALLADPHWVTEDDADAILACRNRNEPRIPLREVLRRCGYAVLTSQSGRRRLVRKKSR